MSPKFNTIFFVLIGLLTVPFLKCYASGSFQIADLHITLLSEELFRNNYQSFPENTLHELTEFYSVGGRIAGFSVAVPEYPDIKNTKSLDSSFENIIFFYRALIDSFETIRKLHFAEKEQLVPFLSLEGITPQIAQKILNSNDYPEIKIIGIVHNHPNEFAASSILSGIKDYGLTPEGEKLIISLIHKNITIDVSHLSLKAFNQATLLVEKYGGSVCASHSSADFFNKHSRNLTGKQIERIIQLKGIIGLIFHLPYLNNEDQSLKGLALVVEFFIKNYGMGSIAIGSDFCHGIQLPTMIKSMKDYNLLIKELQECGLNFEAIDSFAFKNIDSLIKQQNR